MDTAALGLALTLGLTANFFCAGACLPVLAPYIMGRTEGARGGLNLGLWFAMGRLPLYLALGSLLSFAGGELVGEDAVAATLAMRGALAAGIIAYGAVTAFGIRTPKVCGYRTGGTILALVFGALIGSLMCPPLILLMGELFVKGDTALTVAAVTVFWAASSILIVASSLISGELARSINRRWEEGKLREVTGWVLIMVGALYVWNILAML